MSDLRSLTPEITFRRGISYAGGLVAIGVIYFVLAKGGLTLASIHPSATPIWPPTGIALAAVLLWGYRTWPAIFIAAMIANATTAGSVATAIAIATGNTLEAVVGAYLVNRWSSGCSTFSRPNSVAKFALICIVIATPISASIGLTSLAAAGYIDRTNFVNAWVTWWLGDVTGALVITPVIVLWASSHDHAFNRNEFLETVGVLATAAVVGLIAYSPLIEQTPSRDPLGFLAILPMLWAALRRGPRDTATVALVLAGITIWGTLTGGGPFTTADLNVSFLLVLMFLISITVPSLLLSADVEVRKKGDCAARRSNSNGRSQSVRKSLSAPMQQNRAFLPWQAMICGSHYMHWACSLPSCVRRSDRGNGQGRSIWSMQRARKWMKCSIRSWICPGSMLGYSYPQLPNSRSRACCKK